MLKKANQSSEEVSLSWKKPFQCSVCSSTSNKNIYLVCESGHVICENCQYTDCRQHRQEGGDGVSKNPWLPKQTAPTNMAPQIKDLASGDHKKHTKNLSAPQNLRKKHNPKNDNRTRSINDALARAVAGIPEMPEDEVANFQEDDEPKEDVETVVEYKNVNFQNSKSNSSSSANVISDEEIDIEIVGLPEDPKKKACPRPVTCPVQECKRMIALDSVMLHFYFDHSKIPRTIIKSHKPYTCRLNPCNLSAKTKCLGIYLLESKKGKTDGQRKINTGTLLQETYMECKSFMLMGARITIKGLKTDGKTQKEVITKPSLPKKKRKPGRHSCQGEPPVCLDFFEDHEVLALWCCKLDNNKDSCSITLLRKDKKESYNYVGEASHIRNDHSAMMMYTQCQCLIVHGAAANRLIDEENNITVLINILE